jgi:hypothetical protein
MITKYKAGFKELFNRYFFCHYINEQSTTQNGAVPLSLIYQGGIN